LRIGGANRGPIFSSKAIEAVHLYSLGIPRVINLICEHALINAYAEQQRPIEPKIIEDIAREFELDQVGPTVPEGSARIDADQYMNDVGEQVEGLIKAWLRKRM
jgi:hypothetical protein